MEIAAQKAHVGRSTIYTWRDSDPEFKKSMDKAYQEGLEFICDLTEAELFKKIYEGKLPAIMYLLSKRHPKYKDRIEVDANVTHHNAMSDEQFALAKEALNRRKNSQKAEQDNQPK